jgi:putative transposase
VRRVAQTLGVAHYNMAGDAELLSELRTLVDERPTYGYRRITALINRERLRKGLARINHKRVYRLMSQNALLLQRYTGKPPGRAHEGKIITIRPNLRWTSDGFEIACWNGRVVRVAFALDTCDREVRNQQEEATARCREPFVPGAPAH